MKTTWREQLAVAAIAACVGAGTTLALDHFTAPDTHIENPTEEHR